jgi:transcriptional antiterminator NusG
MIYVVKVTANQERVVAEMLGREAMARRRESPDSGKEVYSVLYTTGLKGYVLVEANSPGSVEDLAMNVPKTKGILLRRKGGELDSAGTIKIEELEKTLVPRPVVESINKGDLIELIAGPFKGEKARVVRLDKVKNEITVELIEAAVPIPVSVKGEDIKILKKEEND